MSTAVPNPDAVLDEIVSALRRDDLPRAQRAIEAAPGIVPGESLVRLAELNMRRRRWRDAAWLFEQIADRPAALELKRCLCRNLAALEQHRPEVCDTLVNLPAQQDVMIVASSTGRPTIACRRADGSQIVLSPGNDPLAGMVAAMTRIRPILKQGQCVGLCGLGDGYLLHALSRDATSLFLGMQQPVIVLEPDARVALHCLMIHDYTGPQGPIEQRRFWWFVGPSCADDFEHVVQQDPFMGIPVSMLGLGLQGTELQKRLQEIGQRVVERDNDAKARVKRYYESIPTAGVAELFGPGANRKPRVLLLTTRFSTVLQYSTRDSAEAFERIGWEARVLIEPSPAHRLYQVALRRTLDEFKPDLLFQIDHLRYEHGELFPPNLPFCCWVQDHLPNLQNKTAGPSITERDFVLTDANPVYADTFGYPRRQLIGLAKLTRGETGADSTTSTAAKQAAAPIHHSAFNTQHSDDLVFVSNASQLPDELIETKRESYDGSAEGRTLLYESGKRLIHLYRNGGNMPTWFGLLDFVRAMRRELLLDVADRELEAFSPWLAHPLNNALYRHQALAWSAQAADELGLTLAIYGKGWERHPQFGRFARGPVEYGATLDDLSRRSRFNLQIVPFLCLHQRLLDGVVAGGFYLIRAHPADSACGALLDFIHRHLGPEVRDLSAARSAVTSEHRRQLEQLIQACVPCVATTDNDDPIEIIRSWEEIGLLRANEPVLPRLNETSFADAAELRQRLERFVAEPATREEILRAQRQSMLERFTYESGLRRVVGHMHRLLDETARSAGRAAA